MDATKSVRDFLEERDITFQIKNKVQITKFWLRQIFSQGQLIATKTSLYRPDKKW